jgi:hypothetical protein
MTAARTHHLGAPGHPLPCPPRQHTHRGSGLTSESMQMARLESRGEGWSDTHQCPCPSASRGNPQAAQERQKP